MKAADVGVPTIWAVVVPVVDLGAGSVLAAAEEEHPRGSGSDTLETHYRIVVDSYTFV